MTIRDTATAPTERSQDKMNAESLRREYLADIYAYAARRLPLREDAEDATAETFVAAFGQLHRLKTQDVRLWLFGIARHKVSDAARRASRRREVTLEESVYAEALSTEAEESREELRRMLTKLPEDQREAIVLHYVEDLSHEEVALAMKKSLAAVNSLLQRARAGLYKQGKSHFDNPEEN
jgi:RNA polymerase sigma-70 factor (ECF subfamily)